MAVAGLTSTSPDPVSQPVSANAVDRPDPIERFAATPAWTLLAMSPSTRLQVQISLR